MPQNRLHPLNPGRPLPTDSKHWLFSVRLTSRYLTGDLEGSASKESKLTCNFLLDLQLDRTTRPKRALKACIATLRALKVSTLDKRTLEAYFASYSHR
jgi:hypothetical protein